MKFLKALYRNEENIQQSKIIAELQREKSLLTAQLDTLKGQVADA